MRRIIFLLLTLAGSTMSGLMMAGLMTAGSEAQAEEKLLLWGDTHLHTSYSFDAFLNGNHSADPDVAYRYAKGLPVVHPYNRTRVQIETPLDFLVVTDHAEFFGGIRDIYNDGVQVEDPGPIDRLLFWYGARQIRQAIDSGDGPAFFQDLLPVSADPIEAAKSWSDDNSANTRPGAEVSLTNAWRRVGSIADHHNAPGEFTALLGWEWSTIPGGGNLHRVVVTDADAQTASKFLPFSSVTSPFPEDLWEWLATTQEETGARFVAIPHNSNISKGQMFSRRTLRGEEMDADYARMRARWEPIVEVTQIKGDSETHPDLSPDDAFADFELYPWYIQQPPTEPYRAGEGDYVRSALRTGLALEGEVGVNPYRFGMIGSTDSHTGLSSAEEPNFWGKMARDSVPENKQRGALGEGPTGWTMQAAGLAAVWAKQNTRSGIVDAMQRREVYATTGTRIQLRLAAGFDVSDAQTVDEALQAGVPMGGVLGVAPLGAKPRFVVHAQRDPRSAGLDRVQIVKGWVDAHGATHERVFDVVWSGERSVLPDGSLPAVANSVNLDTGQYDRTVGATELNADWVDEAFDSAQSVFYYVRVLEMPTPRHALLDALALGLDEVPEGPSTIQERAYSSPVWYAP